MSVIGSHRFEWNGDQVSRDVREAVQVGLGKAGAALQGQMKVNLNGTSPSAPGSFPGKDTGELGRSIVMNQTPERVRVGTPLDYGRWLEFGFTATAKGNGALPIPLNKEARKILRQSKAAGGLKNAAPGLVLIQRRGKPPLLVQTSGKGTRGGKAWKPMFVLKKSIRVAPRPWVRRSAAMAEPAMQRALIDGTTSALAGRISSQNRGAA